jgi:hypothetical protein
MLKQMKWVGALAAAFAVLVACTSEEGPQQLGPQEGAAQVSVNGLSASGIQSMVVTAQPANVSKSLAYNADGGTFTGRLVLPVGDQTLTANGYGSDPDAGVVATGTATVRIEANVTSAVTMRIYDQTPPPPQPDIAPYILSVTASKADLFVNEAITVAVNAVDVDGDPLSYAWTSDCASGVFADPSAATTTWRSSTAGSCTLSVRVTGRTPELSVSESVNVAVYSQPPDGGPGEGSAQVNGEYVARPTVHSLYMTCNSGSCSSAFVYRSYGTANFQPVQAGRQYYVDVNVDFATQYGTFNASMAIECDGVAQTLQPGPDTCAGQGGYCYRAYLWTAPSTRQACKITGSAANGSLTDSFSAGVFVQ